MIRYLLLLLPLSTVTAEVPSTPKKNSINLEETLPRNPLNSKDLQAYISFQGASSCSSLPRGINYGLGARYAKPYFPIGIDTSVNYTKAYPHSSIELSYTLKEEALNNLRQDFLREDEPFFESHWTHISESTYLFAKTFFPFYSDSQNILSSFYFGPFATIGYNSITNGFENEMLENGWVEGHLLQFPLKSILATTGFSFGKNIRFDHGFFMFLQTDIGFQSFRHLQGKLPESLISMKLDGWGEIRSSRYFNFINRSPSISLQAGIGF